MHSPTLFLHFYKNEYLLSQYNRMQHKLMQNINYDSVLNNTIQYNISHRTIKIQYNMNWNMMGEKMLIEGQYIR